MILLKQENIFLEEQCMVIIVNIVTKRSEVNLMPYKVVGNKVLHNINGQWTIKQTASSHTKALRTVHLLQGIDHGWKPTNKR